MSERQQEADGVRNALTVARRFGGIDGEHHKLWVIDQMVRALTGDGYAEFVADATREGHSWDTGIAP